MGTGTRKKPPRKRPRRATIRGTSRRIIEAVELTRALEARLADYQRLMTCLREPSPKCRLLSRRRRLDLKQTIAGRMNIFKFRCFPRRHFFGCNGQFTAMTPRSPVKEHDEAALLVLRERGSDQEILKTRLSLAILSNFSILRTVSTRRVSFFSLIIRRVKFRAFSSNSAAVMGLRGVPLK